MRNKVISLAAVALLGATLAACGSNDLVALPQIPPESEWVLPVLETHTLSDVVISDGQACALDAEGRLIVFGGPAYAFKDGTGIKVGDVTVKVGEKFGSARTMEIEEGYQCGGKTYPAFRLPEATIDPPEKVK